MALDKAREAKYWRLEDEAKAERVRQFQEDLARPFDANGLWMYAKARLANAGERLEVDEMNKKFIRALCCYFTEDPQFEILGEGFRLDKGLLIMGNVGTGKTHLLKAFSRNKRQCYNVISCDEIAGRYTRKDGGGYDALERFIHSHREAMGDPRVFNQRVIGWCYDDLGTERTAKNFGNEANVMEQIILARYTSRHEYPWHQTHITTNLTEQEMEAMYGSRVVSRMREMFNLLVLGGNDRRST